TPPLEIGPDKRQADTVIVDIIDAQHRSRSQLTLYPDIALDGIRHLELIARDDCAVRQAASALEERVALVGIKLITRVRGFERRVDLADQADDVLDGLPDKVRVVSVRMFSIHVNGRAIRSRHKRVAIEIR